MEKISATVAQNDAAIHRNANLHEVSKVRISHATSGTMIGQQVGEGSALDREFSGPVHLIGDGLAPFPIVIALWG